MSNSWFSRLLWRFLSPPSCSRLSISLLLTDLYSFNSFLEYARRLNEIRTPLYHFLNLARGSIVLKHADILCLVGIRKGVFSWYSR